MKSTSPLKPISKNKHEITTSLVHFAWMPGIVHFLPTNEFSIKPLKVKGSAVEQISQPWPHTTRLGTRIPRASESSVLLYHLFRIVAHCLTEAENHREEELLGTGIEIWVNYDDLTRAYPKNGGLCGEWPNHLMGTKSVDGNPKN